MGALYKSIWIDKTTGDQLFTSYSQLDGKTTGALGVVSAPAVDEATDDAVSSATFKFFKDSMSLRDRLSEDLKFAMKARDQLRMDVIRMIKAAVLNKEVEMKKDLDDAEMSRIMTTMIKQRKESVEQYEKGQRAELAAKERQEISIIETYLPKAISPEELAQTVEAVIRESGANSVKDMGAVMKTVMARLAGQPVDGKQVSDLVRSKLK
jgi:uncharacterized protein YqeY